MRLERQTARLVDRPHRHTHSLAGVGGLVCITTPEARNDEQQKTALKCGEMSPDVGRADAGPPEEGVQVREKEPRAWVNGFRRAACRAVM